MISTNNYVFYGVITLVFIVFICVFIGYLVWWSCYRSAETKDQFYDPFHYPLSKGKLQISSDYNTIKQNQIRPYTGMGKDIDVYMSVLDNKDQKVVHKEINDKHVLTQGNRVISIEHIQILHPDQITIFIPNQELVDKDDEKKLLAPNVVQHVLCKSQYARGIFERLKKDHQCTWTVDSFQFPPVLRKRYYDEPKDRNVYLHPAGASWMKHTDTVIRAWLQNPDWPQLIITCRGWCIDNHKNMLQKISKNNAGNIKVYNLLSTDDLSTLQKHAGVLITPSACEGFGHCVYEAMENGNLLITSDIPPLNEVLIDGKNSILIPPTASHSIGDSKSKFKWLRGLSKRVGKAGSSCFDISVDGIEGAVNRSLKLSDLDYNKLRLNAVQTVHQLARDGQESLKSTFKKVGLNMKKGPDVNDNICKTLSKL